MENFDSSAKPSAEISNSRENTARLEKLTKLDCVIDLLGKEVRSISDTFKSFERPRKWAALTELMTPDNQMLTPKLSIRRNNVLQVRQDLIDRVYDGTEGHSLPK